MIDLLTKTNQMLSDTYPEIKHKYGSRGKDKLRNVHGWMCDIAENIWDNPEIYTIMGYRKNGSGIQLSLDRKRLLRPRKANVSILNHMKKPIVAISLRDIDRNFVQNFGNFFDSCASESEDVLGSNIFFAQVSFVKTDGFYYYENFKIKRDRFGKPKTEGITKRDLIPFYKLYKKRSNGKYAHFVIPYISHPCYSASQSITSFACMRPGQSYGEILEESGVFFENEFVKWAERYTNLNNIISIFEQWKNLYEKGQNQRKWTSLYA